MSALLMEPRARRRISLTALIDVVFILLMFFMLTSRFSQWQILTLSAATASDESVEVFPEPALIVMNRQGQFFLDAVAGKTFGVAELRAAISPETQSVLIPHAESSVQTLVEAMAKLKRGGFAELTLGDSLSAENFPAQEAEISAAVYDSVTVHE